MRIAHQRPTHTFRPYPVPQPARSLRRSRIEQRRAMAGPPRYESSSPVAQRKTLGMPDEVRTFPKGKLELVRIAGGVIGRLTLEPGWRWSEHVKPTAGTPSCQAPHFQYHVCGRLRIRMDDGTEFEAGPGDVTSLPQGHDAWVVGDEPVVIVDWQGAKHYARHYARH